MSNENITSMYNTATVDIIDGTHDRPDQSRCITVKDDISIQLQIR